MKKRILLFACFLIFTSVVSAHKAPAAKNCERVGVLSAADDYFRSRASGEWNDIAVWESSPDNSTWVLASMWPGSAAKTISIRMGHYVNVSNNQDMDQVVIENGGVLSHLGGILTINDGAGDDMIVQNGGAFTLGSDGNAPVFSPATATVNINTGGTLRLSATGLTGAGVGVNASNYIYSHASVLEYTPIFSFSTANVTYFPNANATTIPIFRLTSNVFLVGANSPTVFNGIFEAIGNVTFDNTGTKTFRNGIVGSGNISVFEPCGKFIINGTTASLGGSGSLSLPASGMDIGSSTTVTMSSDKSVTGNIALLSNALITLGNFNLTMTGNISGGSATSHVVTNGSGKLVLNNITGTPRIFPVGANATTINPMAIFNGGGFNYGLRVEIGINPTIGIPAQAVNRTWFVTPNGTPGMVNTNFFYYPGEGNAGFNYTTNLELGHYTGVWNVIQTGLVPAGGYQVATTVSTFGSNTEAPLVLANLGAILPAANAVDVNYFTGIKQNSNHLLKWKLTCNNTSAVNITMERSVDGRHYRAIHTEDATALRCEQPFSFIDISPEAGVNYYRIKITDDAGKIIYSSIVSLINAAKGMELMNIAPNPVVNGAFILKISTAAKMEVRVMISDVQGRVVQKQNADLIAGFNSIPVNVSAFAKGSYQLTVFANDLKTRSLGFVVK